MRRALTVVAAGLALALIGLELSGVPALPRFTVALLLGGAATALTPPGRARPAVAALALLAAVQWYGVPLTDRPALFVRQAVAIAAGLLIAALVAAGIRTRHAVAWTVVLGIGVLAPGLYVLDPAPAWAFGYRLAHRADFTRAAADLSSGSDTFEDRLGLADDGPRHIVETGWGYGFMYVGDIPGLSLMAEMDGAGVVVGRGWIWIEPRWRDDARRR